MAMQYQQALEAELEQVNQLLRRGGNKRELRKRRGKIKVALHNFKARVAADFAEAYKKQQRRFEIPKQAGFGDLETFTAVKVGRFMATEDIRECPQCRGQFVTIKADPELNCSACAKIAATK